MRNVGLFFAFLALTTVPAIGGIALPTGSCPTTVSRVKSRHDHRRVYEAGVGVTSPVLLHPSPVITSQDVLAACTPHILTVVLIVGGDGTPKIRSMNANVDAACDAQAVAALQQSQFQAGTLDGKPVPVAVCVRVPFLQKQAPVPQLISCAPPDASSYQPMATGDPLRPPPGTRMPVLLNYPTEIPTWAKKSKLHGTALISAVVNEDGLPLNIQIVRGVSREFDRNAIAIVSQYHFRPATLRGKPIPVRMMFELDLHMR